VWGYGLCKINHEVDEVFLDFYNNTVGPYWDNARKLVEDEYRSLPFPFEQIQSPEFEIIVEWTLDQFMGYLTSWSATQKYIKSHKINPVELVTEKLKPHWPSDELKCLTFPVFLKLGRIHKAQSH
jgi:hypothetical protein